MGAKLLISCVYDEDGKPHQSYGVELNNKRYYDLSFNKKLVERFIEFLNKDDAPLAHIDIIIEDFFLSQEII